MALTHSGIPRVTVLGGTGFAGRHIVAAFAAAGWHTTIAARRPPGGPPPPGSRYATIDLAAPPAAIAAALAGTRPDVVVNAAGAYWRMTGAQMRESLVTTTDRLLAALPLLASRPRLIHLGSVTEYATAASGTLLDERAPLGEESATYAGAKVAASAAVCRAAAAGTVNATVLRVTNSIGPGVDPASLLGKVSRALRDARRDDGPAHIVLAPLRAARDYLDVRDLGEAVVTAAVRGESGQVVNIGTGSAVAVRGLVDRLIAVSGVRARVEEREDAPSSPGPVADWLAVDPGTAARHLGWRAWRPIDRAVADLWRADIDADHSIMGRSPVDAVTG